MYLPSRNTWRCSELPTVWSIPVIATTLWTALFLGVALWRFGREEFELLIDCVVVTDAEVEIRYVMPLSRAGPHRRFCHLRLDYRGGLSRRL